MAVDPQQDTKQAVAPVVAGPVIPAADDCSMVSRVWAVFRREPMLLVTCSYLFVSIVGLWDSYWFYRRFDIPVLEYMQSADYFVAGLRRPDYLLLLAWTLLFSVLALWPERWRKRNPARAAEMDRRWWFRALAPRRGDWWAYFGLHPETMTTVAAVVVMGLVLFANSDSRATKIQRGGGNVVEATVSGAGTLAGDWRMLGTSSAFVFLWNPQERRAEVVPIEALSSIRPQGWRAEAASQATDGDAAPAETGDGK